MREFCRICEGTCLAISGILIFIAGIVTIIFKPLSSSVLNDIVQGAALVEGTDAFESWTSTAHIYFNVYLFHVLNPDGVMQGEFPNFKEYGPYVYDEYVSKQVVRVDEDLDEVYYTVTKNYHFNATLSGNMSEDDEITIINPAYLGPINVMTTFPPAILEKYGNEVIKLFPNQNTIFLTGKVKNILFDGLPVICNARKYKELALMCSVLQSKKPTTLRQNGREGVYAFSFFHKMNGSIQGPFAQNRGLKNMSQLGDITSVKNKRVLNFWSSAACNTIKGSDSFTWPPMTERQPRLYMYADGICRSVWIKYKDDVLMNGLTGWRYIYPEEGWSTEEIECYCPVEKNVVRCPPRGLLDISKCQEAPVIMSAPHFLYGDPDLLRYAGNLKPVEEKHQSFYIVDPLTGLRLDSRERIQLNIRLEKLPVILLSNVSSGYIPILWFEEGGFPEKHTVKRAYQAHRSIHMAKYLECIPVVFGAFLMLAAFILCNSSKRPVKRFVSQIQDDIIISPRVTSQAIVRRMPHRPKIMFE